MNLFSLMKLAFGLFGAAAVSYLAVDEYEKILAKNKKEEDKKNQDLKDLGVNPEKFKQEIEEVPVKDDLVKALYLVADSNWDIETTWAENYITKENLMHLRQFTDPQTGVERFDILVEILKDIPGNYRRPGIGDYMRYFKQFRNEIQEKFSLRTWTCLEGYFAVVHKGEDGHNYLGAVVIPKELYKSFATEGNDGLANYVKHIRKEGFDSIDLSPYVGWENTKVVDVKLLYKFSFNRNDLDLSTAQDLVEHFYYNIEIKRDPNDDRMGIQYDHVVFNTYNPSSGGWSLFHFYDTFYEEVEVE